MRAALGLAALVLASACASSPTAACDRACRLATAREAATTGILPASAKFTENGATRPADASWLKSATKVSIHGEYADTSGEHAIIVGTATGADQRSAVFSLRLRLKGASPTEAELLVVHQGEAGLFPPSVPMTRDPLFDAKIEPAQRSPAAKMVAIANSYFDGIEKHDGKDVPVTPDCDRVENGVQTTRSQTYVVSGCNSLEAFVYIPEVRERRYPIVDEERGVVVAAIAFYIPGGDYKRVINSQETMRHYDPRSLFLFEAFKIVDGKIAKIEATMRNVPLGTSMGWQ
jgi:hypothetical protein